MGVVGATPLLVYTRIEANRRKTRVLLASFALEPTPGLLRSSSLAAC